MNPRPTLFYFATAIIGTGITVLTIFLVIRLTGGHCDKDKICLTVECVQATAEIISYLDTSIDPCHNFYSFACGNFLKNSELSEDQLYVSTSSVIYDETQRKLKESLEEPIDPNELHYIKMLKTYYQACNNIVAVERLELDVARFILNKGGGWPVIEGPNWKKHSFYWYNTVYKLKDLGLETNYFMKLTVVNDIENPGRKIIKLSLPDLGLPHGILTSGNHEVTRIYYHYMISVAKQMGANESRAVDELNHSLEFEINLAHIATRDNDYTRFTFSELNNKFQNIPLFEYVHNMMLPIVTIAKNDNIVVEISSYLKGLDVLLGKTPKRVQANYIMWRVIATLIPYLNEGLRERAFAHESFVYDNFEKPSRWQQCVKETNERLPTLLSSLYLEKYFNVISKDRATALIRTIEKEFLNVLETTSRIDERTKDLAVMKATQITDFVAYSEQILDIDQMEKVYSRLEVNSEEFLQSYLNITKFHRELVIKSLRKPSHDEGWFDPSLITEMYTSYSRAENAISVSAGALQGLIFNKDHPEYLNYGGLGFFIARSITQGFDLWVTDNDVLHNKCFIDQYSNFSIPEMYESLNGTVTLIENIADNAGLALAYKTYKKWVEDYYEPHNLAAFSYTPNQLFWISFAINQCTKEKSEFLKQLLKNYRGTPAQFRVIGAVGNSKDFAIDFNCPLGSPMNPYNKCNII